MLDTIAMKADWPVRSDYHHPLGRRMLLPPRCNEIRFWLSDAGDRVSWVECSLPNVLFGSNGYVIEDQQQLDQAIFKVSDVMSDFAYVSDISDWKVRRLELCWHFAMLAK